MKDFFNRAIKEGDRIVYPTRRGSELTMNSGRVVSVEEDRIVIEPELRATWGRATDEGQRLSTIRETHRVVVLAVP